MEIGNILTLSDDNEYAIVDYFIYNGVNYIYLVDINNNTNMIYAKVNNDEIIVLNDPDEIEHVIKLINEHVHSESYKTNLENYND